MKTKRFLAILVILNMILTLLPYGPLSAMETGEITDNPTVPETSAQLVVTENTDPLSVIETSEVTDNPAILTSSVMPAAVTENTDQFSLMAAGPVIYNPAVLKYSVMPAAIAQNADFLNLSSTRNCGFNHIYRFLDDKNNMKFFS